MPPLEKQSTATNRRSNKPIMEKKRRARINNCLNELKNLLLEAMKKDPTRHSKLEKADILEMTVRHLQQLRQRQAALTVATDPEVVTKYRAGFHECADEVQRYVKRSEGMEPTVKQRLLDHISNCVQGLRSPSSPTSSGAIYFNNRLLLNVTPSRLPSGDLALLLPREWTNTPKPNCNRGLLMSASPDNFAPLTVNCPSAPSSPLSNTLRNDSPATSDYSSSESNSSLADNRHINFQNAFNSRRSHQMDDNPSKYAIYRPQSQLRWSEDEDEEMPVPVDLSSARDGDQMWRPW